MDLSQITSELAAVQKTLAGVTGTQETIVSALKSVAESNMATVKALADMQTAQTKGATPSTNADAVAPPTSIKSFDDLPEALQKSLVAEVMGALTNE